MANVGLSRFALMMPAMAGAVEGAGHAISTSAEATARMAGGPCFRLFLSPLTTES